MDVETETTTTTTTDPAGPSVVEKPSQEKTKEVRKRRINRLFPGGGSKANANGISKQQKHQQTEKQQQRKKKKKSGNIQKTDGTIRLERLRRKAAWYQKSDLLPTGPETLKKIVKAAFAYYRVNNGLLPLESTASAAILTGSEDETPIADVFTGRWKTYIKGESKKKDSSRKKNDDNSNNDEDGNKKKRRKGEKVAIGPEALQDLQRAHAHYVGKVLLTASQIAENVSPNTTIKRGGVTMVKASQLDLAAKLLDNYANDGCRWNLDIESVNHGPPCVDSC